MIIIMIIIIIIMISIVTSIITMITMVRHTHLQLPPMQLLEPGSVHMLWIHCNLSFRLVVAMRILILIIMWMIIIKITFSNYATKITMLMTILKHPQATQLTQMGQNAIS